MPVAAPSRSAIRSSARATSSPCRATCFEASGGAAALIVGTSARLTQRLGRLTHALGEFLTLELTRGVVGGLSLVAAGLTGSGHALDLILEALGAVGEPFLFAGKPPPRIVARSAAVSSPGLVVQAPLRIGELASLEL